MFSGLVETTGLITQLSQNPSGITLSIAPKISFENLVIGESIAVNGACLTLTHFDEKTFTVLLVPETIKRTTFNAIKMGDLVNLERSLLANSRIGGHYVQGHVDGEGEIIQLSENTQSGLILTISIPSDLTQYIVNKGYIAVDGMSLTVITIKENAFTLTLIPHTQTMTIAQTYQVGKKVNIEVDILAKYVEKLIGRKPDE